MSNLLISVDYDGTYSADPSTFDLIISEFQQNGHTCIVVTARDEIEPVKVNPNLGIDVYYTSGNDKDPYMRDKHGLDVDIWIEDRPQSVGKVDDWLYDPDQKHWYQKCDACDGTGEHMQVSLGPNGPIYREDSCSDCDGSGRWVPPSE